MSQKGIDVFLEKSRQNKSLLLFAFSCRHVRKIGVRPHLKQWWSAPDFTTQPVTIGSDRPESLDREVEPSPFRYLVDTTLKANKHFTCLLVDFSAVQKISELPPRIGGLKALIDAKITGLGPCNSSVQEGFYRPVFPVTIRFVFRQGVGKSQKGIGVLDLIQLLMKLHGFLRSKS